MTIFARELNSSGGFFDVPASREELNRIEAEASVPDFWNDQEAAQKLLQDRSRLEKKIERQEQFQSQIDDAAVLFEFAEEDDSSIGELDSLLKKLEHELGQASNQTRRYSARNAITGAMRSARRTGIAIATAADTTRTSAAIA